MNAFAVPGFTGRPPPFDAGLTIGTLRSSQRDGEFDGAQCVAFDKRGRLFVVDTGNARVQVFEPDGSFVLKFGSLGDGDGQFRAPYAVAIDDLNDEAFVTDSRRGDVQVFSTLDGSFVRSLTRGIELEWPEGICVDSRHREVLVSSALSCVVRVLSLSSSSDTQAAPILFAFGVKGSGDGELQMARGIAVDPQRRIVIADNMNHRVQVFSRLDDHRASFALKFGERGMAAGQFRSPNGVCVDHQGRIIVADAMNERLQAFSAQGEPIATFACPEEPWHVALDQRHARIAFTCGHRVHVIDADRLLPFLWCPEHHRFASKAIKQLVLVLLMLRAASPIVRPLPNELMFEIFRFL